MTELIDLKVGDIFYRKGKKYKVYLKIKYPENRYQIPCLIWPPTGLYQDIWSDAKVKPVVRITS